MNLWIFKKKINKNNIYLHFFSWAAGGSGAKGDDGCRGQQHLPGVSATLQTRCCYLVQTGWREQSGAQPGKHTCEDRSIEAILRNITFEPVFVWSPGGNRWPTGSDRAGHFNSPGWAVSRRSLPLPGGGARLPLDCRDRPSDRLEPLCRPSSRLLVQIFVSEQWNPALVRRRDGADSPWKHRPALSGTGIPPPSEPAPSRGRLDGALQGEREGGAT